MFVFLQLNLPTLTKDEMSVIGENATLNSSSTTLKLNVFNLEHVKFTLTDSSKAKVESWLWLQ